MANCPCCSNRMLRHIRHNQVYWFCRDCWQEMPLLEPNDNILSFSTTLKRSLITATRPLVQV